jgi:hypothetical protein
MGLGLDRAYVTLNGSRSEGVPAHQGVVQPKAHQALSSTLGGLQIEQTRLDMAAQALTASTSLFIMYSNDGKSGSRNRAHDGIDAP